jgi:hypothetical protein
LGREDREMERACKTCCTKKQRVKKERIPMRRLELVFYTMVLLMLKDAKTLFASIEKERDKTVRDQGTWIKDEHRNSPTRPPTHKINK